MHTELVYLTRIILPAQIFHIIGGLLSATLQAKDKHAIPALAPLLYTSSIIIGGVWTGTAAGIRVGGPGWQPLGAFWLTLVWQPPHQLGWSLRLNLRHPDLKAYFIRSLPIMLGFSIIVLDDWFSRREGSPRCRRHRGHTELCEILDEGSDGRLRLRHWCRCLSNAEPSAPDRGS